MEELGAFLESESACKAPENSSLLSIRDLLGSCSVNCSELLVGIIVVVTQGGCG